MKSSLAIRVGTEYKRREKVASKIKTLGDESIIIICVCCVFLFYLDITLIRDVAFCGGNGQRGSLLGRINN